MNILVIEDDLETATAVARTLEADGHRVTISTDGLDGEALAEFGSFDAFIVDRMLPGQDGLTLVKRLRAMGMGTPILFLTAMSGIDDRVEGLRAGADDYLTKPFAHAELLARVAAITRRAQIHGAESTMIETSGIQIDLVRRTVTREGHPIDLVTQEFKLLEYLMRNVGKVVTRKMLLEVVWDLHFDPRTNIVETHVSRLRTKLNQGDRKDMIRTVRGVGYILSRT